MRARRGRDTADTAPGRAMIAVLLLVLGAVLVSSAARRAGVPAPIALAVAGLAVSYVPGVPGFRLDPHLALFVFVPPLVYADSLESSYLNLRANARPIALLSVGLVLVTVPAVGLVVHAVVPGTPWPVAFLLGAVLAPTDAVAAVSTARRLGLPRRLVTVLVAESVVNDATGMTVFRLALAVALGGGTTLLGGTAQFLVAAIGGVATGLLLAVLVNLLRRRLADAVAETAVSVLVPFGACLAAEAVHASGILAVLAAGLYAGHHAPASSHEARLQEKATWRLVTHMLEAVTFVLIGLQLPAVLGALGTVDAGRLALAAAAVFCALALTRICWVFPATYVPRLLSARLRERDPAPPWQMPAAVSWAGIRGVVSLAAAFAVPPTVPHRDLLLFLTFCVVLSTLLLQGLTFPVLVHRLGLRAEHQAYQDDLAEAVAQETAARAAWERVEQLVHDGAVPGHVLDRLRETAQHRRHTAWERLSAPGRPVVRETPTAAYRRLRREMLAAERGAFVRLRGEGRIDDEVLRRVLHRLDLEEAMLCRD
ncbi:Na+/H+ antiporter [Streptomyces morookaense]|uniref:Na+/H+ antiporter n=1 Tax=Streptomyces morookaense TaxID=1970 RepID=UPI0033F03044